MSRQEKLQKLETLLAGTSFGIKISDQGPTLVQMNDGETVEVVSGNGDDFIEFLEAWHSLNGEIASQGTVILGRTNA